MSAEVPGLAVFLNGINLDGGRNVNGYELHGDTRASRAVSWRKQTVESPFVEGEYDVRAVRGNITEVVAVWVYAKDANQFEQRVQAIIEPLAAPSFNIIWKLDDLTETWNCTYSDYTIETQREFLYARLGVVRMSIVRRPRVTRVYNASTTWTG